MGSIFDKAPTYSADGFGIPEDDIKHPDNTDLSRKIQRYYEELDESDPANWPTDDETRTQPPFPGTEGETRND